MHCPFCAHRDTRVVDSRLTEPADSVRRRRECESCGQRFTTYERVESLPLTVRKRDGRAEAFDREKLVRGVVRAAYPRTLDPASLAPIAERVADELREAGGELPSDRIGELVLRELRHLDPVVYVRFASVYRDFGNVDEFEAELRRLGAEAAPGRDQLPLEGADGAPVPSGSKRSMGTSPRDRGGQGRGAPKSTRREHVPRR
jgi:transcriptional repressor NrdR